MKELKPTEIVKDYESFLITPLSSMLTRIEDNYPDFSVGDSYYRFNCLLNEILPDFSLSYQEWAELILSVTNQDEKPADEFEGDIIDILFYLALNLKFSMGGEIILSIPYDSKIDYEQKHHRLNCSRGCPVLTN